MQIIRGGRKKIIVGEKNWVEELKRGKKYYIKVGEKDLKTRGCAATGNLMVGGKNRGNDRNAKYISL